MNIVSPGPNCDKKIGALLASSHYVSLIVRSFLSQAKWSQE